MSSIFIAGLVVLVVALTVVYPYVGVLGWFWISFLNPHQVAWGPLTGLPLAAIIAATTLLALVFSREPKRFPITAVTVLMLMLAAWITLTTALAQVPEEAWKPWDRAIKILLMTFVAIALMHTRERIHALVWLTVVCFAYYGVRGGFFTIATGGAYHVWGPPSSFIADNNALALALLMAAPFVRYLQLQADSVWLRRGLLAVLVLLVFSVIGSQSRGAFLALVATGGFLVWKSPYRGRMLVLGVLVALVAVWFVPESWVARMESIRNYEEDGSAMGRLQAWEFAIDVALRWPLTGGGFAVYYDEALFLSMVPEAPTSRNFHSVYFEVLGQQGFVGLAIFLLLAFATWRTFSKIIRIAKHREELRWARDLAAMSQVSMVAYLTAGAFQNLAFYDFYYLIVALGQVTYLCVRAEVGEEAATPAKFGRSARLRRGTPRPYGPPGPKGEGEEAVSTGSSRT